MQWAAVHGPRLVLDRLLLGLSPETEGQRIATCDGQQIIQCTQGARAVGIHPGLRRASALALAHDLQLLDHNPALAQQSLQEIGQWLLQFSPRVTIYTPHTIVLELGRSLRLFGGPERLMQGIRQGLMRQGFQIRTALAPSARAAYLLSLWQDQACIAHESALSQALAALPLSLLDSAQAHQTSLLQLGVQCMGELLQLPRQGLAQRYGPGILEELDLALGHRLEALACLSPLTHFNAQIDLLYGVEQAAALLQVGHILIDRLCAWLKARGLATREAILEAVHEGRSGQPPSSTRIPIRLTQASREPARMLTLLRERLAITRLPQATQTLRLQCQHTVAQASAVGSLFPELHAPEPPEGRSASGKARASESGLSDSLARLLERLQSRLGAEQVQRLAPLPDHRPERAFQASAWTPPARQSPQGLATPPGQGSVLPRPLWLLSPPVAIQERRHRPYWNGPLALLAGPERIETGWWDDQLVERDYFIAQTEQAAWVWIFRTRPTQGDSGWFLQGMFG
jgi:protein ImuB